MSESNELFTSVNHIKNKVDALEKIELLKLRSDKETKELYLNKLKADAKLKQVYCAINGDLSQQEIVEVTMTSKATVSRKIEELREDGLIEVRDTIGNKVYYQHSIPEKAFGLSRIVNK